jgi:hypothetical protein
MVRRSAEGDGTEWRELWFTLWFNALPAGRPLPTALAALESQSTSGPAIAATTV